MFFCHIKTKTNTNKKNTHKTQSTPKPPKKQSLHRFWVANQDWYIKQRNCIQIQQQRLHHHTREQRFSLSDSTSSARENIKESHVL